MTSETQNAEVKTQSPMKAIRAKCLDCCCGSSKEVGLCQIKDCSLYPYRFGRRPGVEKKAATPAQIERLKRAREARLNSRISDFPLLENREKLENIRDEG